VGTVSTGSIRSADATTIPLHLDGDGSPVILIGGAYNDRSTMAGVAEAISSGSLAPVTYDRRGRGASTNNDSRFEPERELEDLSALIEAVGGSVSVFGHSSGAVLALEAAMQRLPIERPRSTNLRTSSSGHDRCPRTTSTSACPRWFARDGGTTRSFCSRPKRSAFPLRSSRGCAPAQHGTGLPLSRIRCLTTWLFITATHCPPDASPSSDSGSSRSRVVSPFPGSAQPRGRWRKRFPGRSI
jgi:pimeloyl-ACP methyl ester carboxylesterase